VNVLLDREAEVDPSPRRRGAVVAVLAAAMASLVVIASVVAWSALREEPDPRTLTLDGLDVEVTEFTRRADAMMGVNTPKKKTSGPGMSMPGMGSIPGALPHGQERVDVQVEVRNVGQAETGLDAEAFELWSKDTQVKLLAPTVSNLAEATLSPGSRLVGTLTFVIAQGTSPLELRHSGDSRAVPLDQSTQATPHDAEASQHE